MKSKPEQDFRQKRVRKLEEGLKKLLNMSFDVKSQDMLVVKQVARKALSDD